MIIFDLDGTLADCSHRRHFVDPSKNNDYELVYLENEQTRNWKGHYRPGFCDFSDMPIIDPEWRNIKSKQKWKPDYQSFYEACDKDTPITPVIDFWNEQISLGSMHANMIWSGRCESVREKTEQWLENHLHRFESHQLMMRPIGNTEPDEVLKERWLNELCSHVSLNLDTEKTTRDCHDIDFVFDDRPKVIRMWRKRGIFVFNCAQHEEEF